MRVRKSEEAGKEPRRSAPGSTKEWRLLESVGEESREALFLDRLKSVMPGTVYAWANDERPRPSEAPFTLHSP
jgi:hypothetical protein